MNARINIDNVNPVSHKALGYERMLENLSNRSNPDLEKDIKAAARELEATVKASQDGATLRIYSPNDTRNKALSSGNVAFTGLSQTFSVAYANDEYIGTELLPVVSTGGNLSFEYKIRDRSKDLSIPDDTIGTSGDVNEIDVGLKKDVVSLKKHSLKQGLDAWTNLSMEDVVRELLTGTNNVRDAMELAREKRIADIVTTAANYGSNTVTLTGSNQWTNGNGDPFGLVNQAKRSIWRGVGPSSLVIAIDRLTYDTLLGHAQVLSRLAQGTLVNTEVLARLFGVEKVFVGSGQYNTANDGAAESDARLWGQGNLAILRVNRSPGRQNVSFGYTFQDNEEVSSWFENGKGGKGQQVVQVARADQHKVTAADAGYLIKGCI